MTVTVVVAPAVAPPVVTVGSQTPASTPNLEYTYATKDLAQAGRVAPTVGLVRTGGYSEAGDGGDCEWSAVTDGTSETFDLVDATSRRFRPYRKELRFKTLGGVANGYRDSASGVGTDNLAALNRLKAALLTGEYKRLIFEPGIYNFSDEWEVLGDALGDLTVEAWGAALVCTKATAAINDHFIRLKNTADNGGQLVILGLEAAMNRPSVRTTGADMILIEGFRSTILDGVTVPCADNMGVAFDRSSAATWVPDEIIVRNGRFGGRTFAGAHSHGSIGDTAIWVPKGAKWIDVQARVRSTGDDGIYLGPLPVVEGSMVARPSWRVECDVEGAGAYGVKIENPNGTLRGRIDWTNCAALGLVPALDGVTGNTVDNVKVDVEITRAGQLAAGDIGTSMLTKEDPVGVYIYGNAADVNLGRTTISGSRSAAIRLQASTGQTISGLRGSPVITRCNVAANGSATGGTVGHIARSETGGGLVTRLALTPEFHGCTGPLVSWTTSTSADDTLNRISAKVYDHILDETAYTRKTLADFHVNSGTGRCKSFTLDMDLYNCTVPTQWLRVAGGNSVQDIVLRGRTEDGEFRFGGRHTGVVNNGGAKIEQAKRFAFQRDGSSSSVYVNLDPDGFWIIEAWDASATINGAYWRGTWNPAAQTVTTEESVAGEDSTGFVVELNAASTVFPNAVIAGSVEVRAAASATTLKANILATRVADAGGVKVS